MDDRDEPGRIEIELTSHEPSRPSAGRDSDDQLVAEAVDADPGPLGTERGRLIAVGSATAVFALLLGVVLGRAGSGGDLGSAAPVTSDAPPTSVDDAFTTIEPPEPVATAPPTTARRRATTTTLVELSTGSIEVAPIIAGQPIEVIASVDGDEVFVIDPTTGATAALNARVQQFGGPESIRAGAGWILVPSYDGGSQSTLYLDDGTSRSVETAGPGWSMRGLHGSDYFWRFDEHGFFPSTAVEYRYEGTATGREIEVPDAPVAIDPLGGFAVVSSGGVYLVDGEQTVRITTGRLMALGAERAVVHECDELLRCSHIVVDRSTGVRRPLDIVGLAPGARIDPNAWFPVEERLDPSETAIVMMTWNESSNGSPNYGVVDLLTGQYTDFGSRGFLDGMRWTPDGRFVFWLRGGSLEVFDPSTGESVKFSDDLGFVNAFTVRPALPSVDPGGVTSTTTPATTAATTSDG